MNLQNWIDTKLADIAMTLPSQVLENPSSFKCGFNMGYKQAMLDLDRKLEESIQEQIQTTAKHPSTKRL